MVKTLDSTNFEGSLTDLNKVEAYPIRTVGEYEGRNEEKLVRRTYLCDCDSSGGGGEPCDNCR